MGFLFLFVSAIFGNAVVSAMLAFTAKHMWAMFEPGAGPTFGQFFAVFAILLLLGAVVNNNATKAEPPPDLLVSIFSRWAGIAITCGLVLFSAWATGHLFGFINP